MLAFLFVVLPTSARPSKTTSTAATTPTTAQSTPTTTAFTHVNTVTCNFDNDLCGWTQLQDDQIDFKRQKGGTILPGTGPLGDHTTGSKFSLLFVTLL